MVNIFSSGGLWVQDAQINNTHIIIMLWLNISVTLNGRPDCLLRPNNICFAKSVVMNAQKNQFVIHFYVVCQIGWRRAYIFSAIVYVWQKYRYCDRSHLGKDMFVISQRRWQEGWRVTPYTLRGCKQSMNGIVLSISKPGMIEHISPILKNFM